MLKPEFLFFATSYSRPKKNIQKSTKTTIIQFIGHSTEKMDQQQKEIVQSNKMHQPKQVSGKEKKTQNLSIGKNSSCMHLRVTNRTKIKLNEEIINV